MIDSSDVIIEVLDARDPMGTRAPHAEGFLRKEASHKHLVFLLNKCDPNPAPALMRPQHRQALGALLPHVPQAHRRADTSGSREPY